MNTVGIFEFLFPMMVRMIIKEQSSLVSLDGVECRVVQNCQVPAFLMVSYDRAPCASPNMAIVKNCLSKQHRTLGKKLEIDCSRLTFRWSTGNDVSGHYFRHYFLFYNVYVSHKIDACIKQFF